MSLDSGIFACIGALFCAFATHSADKVDFDREIRPILVANCFKCHGPHDEARKAGLRFDSFEGATATLRSGRQAVVPFSPDGSAILGRVSNLDIDERMPPVGHEPLAPAQIALVRRWIDEGGEFSAPWAFRPLEAVSTPVVDDQEWCDGDIDRFVLATREHVDLARPKHDLDPSALLRKLSFDLRGLPPSEADVKAFVAQPTAARFDEWVDRYLADSAFGERWGRHWLDLARYAETLGHEFDYEMPDAWRYRDYVIDALNQDIPLDRFVREQIAGDLQTPRAAMGLSNVAPIATAWWFLGPAVHAPVDVRQDEADRIAGDIDVLGRSLLGLSVACARCHDHKFDPIPAADYYALAGVARNTRRVNGFVQTDSQADGLLRRAVESFEASARIARLEGATKHRTTPGVSDVSGASDAHGATVVDELADHGSSWKCSGSAFACKTPGLHWGSIDSARLDRKLVGSARSTTRSVEHRYLHVRLRGSDATIRPIIDNYWLDERNPLLFEGLLRKVPHHDGAGEWRTETFDLVRFRGERLYIELIDDGDGWIEVDWIAASDDATPPDATAWDVDEDPVLDPARRIEVDAMFADARQAATALAACTPPVRAMIAEEGGSFDESIHVRGASHSPGAVTSRGQLRLLGEHSPTSIEGSGRLELAQSLSNPKNPFLWRTMANRVWLKLFGRGIVETPDDFGQLGSPPWSAELLDFLASNLADHRSFKSLIREIVRSHAYRAVADVGELPGSAWGPLAVRRLDAESIRDAMLAASGRIDLAMGGPSVAAHLSDHMQGRGRPEKSGPVDGAGRRSVYLAVRRNFLDPFMRVFDAPIPSTSCGRRHESNVPAQSLALLNSELVRTIGEYWGDRLGADGQTSEDSRVESVWYAMFARPPRDDESLMAREFLDAERAAQPTASDATTKDRAAYASLTQSLFATKEFIFLR